MKLLIMRFSPSPYHLLSPCPNNPLGVSIPNALNMLPPAARGCSDQAPTHKEQRIHSTLFVSCFLSKWASLYSTRF
jgi:hypothetical protein